MRSKQLLGVVFLLLMASAGAEAAAPQLTGIGISGGGNTTTVVLRASGAFTHTEYRPSENLLLLDLVGVEPGRMSGSTQAVNRPGLLSYHVTRYSGANSAPVARIELALNPSAVVTLAEEQGGLQVQIEGGGRGSAATSGTPALTLVSQKSGAPERAALRQPTPEKPVTVRKVSVLRGRAGMEVEIVADGQVKATTMKLAHPDRVVVDLPNSRLAATAHAVAVNDGEIKEVRVGLREQNPPLTRVVLDLKAAVDYDVVPAGNKIVVKLHGGQAGAAAGSGERPSGGAPSSTVPTSAEVAAGPMVPSAALAEPEAGQPAAEPADGSQKPASDFVFIEPSYKPASAAAAPAAPRAADAKATAEKAAHVIAASGPAKLPLLASPESGTLGAPAVNMAMEQQQASQAPAGGAPAPRYTGEPISVNLKDVDLKDFFRLIHEISGLNIVLDPNVKGTLTLVLDDVPWDQALDIVLQNNQLERRLEGNVLRIATMDTFRREADARRAADEAQALAVPRIQVTHFLSYAHAQEVMPIVKRFLTPRGDVVADVRTNSLLIQDIPSVMPQVQTVLAQLDRKTQEVEIEARVVAATRNFAREIGTQLGFGWGNRPTAIGGASAVGTSPLQQGYTFPPPYFTVPVVATPNLTPGAVPTVTSAAIPLFSNLPAVGATSGISLSNIGSTYRIDSILTLAESRGLLKILSRPRVVTQNNIGATVKQGTRIPVVTLAQLGGPPTTTYVDAELRLQVTPQITAENTIFMNIDVENTTPDFSHQVQGNPSLVTQQATTSVLVTDGGTAVIGGVIQTQNSIAVQQVPLLGNIPVLGNLFKHTAVSTQTQELIFFITPKIVQT